MASLTPTLTYVWLLSTETPAEEHSSISHLPLLSVFYCISTSEMQKSASDDLHQSIPLVTACLTYITARLALISIALQIPVNPADGSSVARPRRVFTSFERQYVCVPRVV